MNKVELFIIGAVAALLITCVYECRTEHSINDLQKDVVIARDAVVIDSLNTQLAWYQMQWEQINSDTSKNTGE